MNPEASHPKFHDPEKMLALATEAARRAGKLLIPRFGAATVETSALRDVKLAEDRAAEETIAGALGGVHPVLSEEAGWIGGAPAPGGLYWAVDPLDGSFNFAAGVPLCCVSIALCYETTPVFGVVLDFLRDETWTGGAGLPLRLNGTEISPAPARRDILATGFASGGPQTTEGLDRALAEWRKIRIFGSAALSLAWVAAGRADGYFERGIRWWDVAGGLALVRTAHGRFTIDQPYPDEKWTMVTPAARLDVFAERGGEV